jgi:predicted metal-dependent phosphoesterase TrpH
MPAHAGADLRDVRADLHSHSNVSDGVLPPQDVVARAHEQGVELYALTDHDEVGGLEPAATAAQRLGLAFVPGVEVSVTWGSTTLHIVGLGVEYRDGRLEARLGAVRSGRIARAQEMAGQLARVGIEGAFDGALVYAGNPQMISRTHFARYLVETGHCRDVKDVFSRYLVEGKPGFVPHAWATLGEAIDMIRDAGGVAIVAHPGRYRLNDLALHALLEEFRELGGTGIEVSTSNHTEREMRRFADLAREFGFEASGGSDFHGPGESESVELGRVARLPPDLTPVWHRFV